MKPPDKSEFALLKTALRERIKRGLVGVFTLVAGIWIAYITQIFIGNLTATTKLEYKVSRYKLSEWLPQNIADVAPLKIGDYSLKDAEFVTIQLWNRTSSNLDRTSIRFDTTPDTTEPFHKVILYNNSLDKDWVEWANPDSNKILEFSVAVLNKNWSADPNVSVRFFYIGSAPKDFRLKTNKPGVDFVIFDQEKVYWWLFGLDGPIFGAATALVLLILVIVTWKLGDRLNQRQFIGYSRVLAKGIATNFPDLPTKEKERFYWLGSRLYIYSTKRLLWKEKNDPTVTIPDDIGEQNETNQ